MSENIYCINTALCECHKLKKNDSVPLGDSQLFQKQSSKINDLKNEYFWDVSWILWPNCSFCDLFTVFLLHSLKRHILIKNKQTSKKTIPMLTQNYVGSGQKGWNNRPYYYNMIMGIFKFCLIVLCIELVCPDETAASKPS